jgi:hypothetical protein
MDFSSQRLLTSCPLFIPIHPHPFVTDFLQSRSAHMFQEQKAHANKDALNCHDVATEMITSEGHLLPAKDVTWADQAKTTALNPVVLSYAVKLAFPVHLIPSQNDMPCKRFNINIPINSA